MKMMVVGGKRSREYAEHIQKQFSVATSILPGFSLEEVERTAVLGNLLERVLVLEQAWTIDGVSTDEKEMRKRIGEMTKQARERGGNEQYVFMARTPESAQLCFEETYDICERAAIVLYEQNVTVVILHELLSTDIAGLRPILVYNPPVTETVETYSVVVDIDDVVSQNNEQIIDTKRVIRKTRGAAVQRAGGSTPWYAQQVGGVQMTDYKVNDIFNPMYGSAADKGFADESPYVADAAGIQLNNIFQQKGSAFVPPMVQPTATIPVSHTVQTGGLSDFIRNKAYKGYTLTFAGPGGSGSTFMALNCAARMYAAGFSVMFVDGDLLGHSAQYLTSLGITDNVLSAEVDRRTLRSGFDMYSATQFMAADGRSWSIPDNVTYDLTIVDIPFHSLPKAYSVLSKSACVAVTVESSNWGIGKAALSLFSVPVDVAPVIRERGRIIYNRSDKLSSGLFGAQVLNEDSIKRQVEAVLGVRAQAFINLPVASIVGSYAAVEDYWFSNKLFSDSYEGATLFDSIIFGLLNS